MSSADPLFQLGICPNCPSDATQRLLFATDESSSPVIEKGEIVGYEPFETLSLFRCLRCSSALLYATGSDFGGISLDELERCDPSEVARLPSTQFIELSNLIWPKERGLPSSVPENIRKIYDRALKAKAEPNSFAVQIRRALEAVCIDRGEPGKHLKTDLEALSNAGVFPPIVAEIAK